jgi:hypothetical protein
VPVTWCVIVTDPPASRRRSLKSVLLSLECFSQERMPLQHSVGNELLLQSVANRSFPEATACLDGLERVDGDTRPT